MLTVKNWQQFQHYKDRNPPWIKLHRALLDDYDFASLPDAAKGQLMLIWIFASQNEGKIPHDAKFLERKLGLTEKCHLDELIKTGFLIPEQPASTDASKTLAECKQDACNVLALARSQESENKNNTTTTETDTRDAFAEFWLAYPRKTAKGDAEKAWKRIRHSAEADAAIFAGLERYKRSGQWQRDGGQFIPHPATWLNGQRWNDEPDEAGPEKPAQRPGVHIGQQQFGQGWGP